MNLMIEDFIPTYPSTDDPEFTRKMTLKEEIRELMKNPRDEYIGNSFWYNYQVIASRVMAPWTGVKSYFLRHEVGLGKTREALAFITNHMEYSNFTKALVLSSSPTVLKAFVDEMAELTGYNKVLSERKFITTGKKSHGKLISAARFVKTEGITKATPAIINHIADEVGVGEFIKSIYDNYDRLVRMDPDDIPREYEDIYDAFTQLVQEIRSRFKDHSVVVDEVHMFKESVSRIKRSHVSMLLLLDSLRDICPILIMTATPVVDTWKDLMSVLGMLYPPSQRDEMEEDIDSMEIEEVVKKWARGKVSDRTAKGLVPANLPLPGIHPYSIILDNGEEIPVQENLLPVYMSTYQTLVTSSFEVSGSKPEFVSVENVKEVSSESGIYSWRKYYDFCPPTIQEETKTPVYSGGEIVGHDTTTTTRMMTVDELITSSKRGYHPSPASYINGGTESVFEVVWNDDGTYSTESGIGKYSAKDAELVKMMKSPEFEGMAGYIHTVWVEFGTKIIAATLNANGWEQYSGVGEIASSNVPRFAVIHGEDMSSSKISSIIAAFNSKENRDGSVLKLIVGSKKSGISISFTNAQFFLEMSSSFNKSSKVQAEGRVFRVSSLAWRQNRVIYTANMIALPAPVTEDYVEDIDNGRIEEKYYYSLEDGGKTIEVTPFTIEIRLNYLAQTKFDVAEVAMEALRSVSLEAEYEKYIDEPTDYTSYNIIYSKPSVIKTKERMKEVISDIWSIPFHKPSMIEAKAAASLVSDHDLVLSRYGIPNPIQDIGSHISSYRGKKESYPLSLIYSQNFFVTKDMRTYSRGIIDYAMRTLLSSPTDEYDFYHLISSTTPHSVRVFLLEMSLGMDNKLLNEEQIDALESRRDLILALYNNGWDTFEPNTIVHILYYLVRPKGYVSKLGITSNPLGESRILTYKGNHTTQSTWLYERNTNIESVYLSSIARSIFDKEMQVVERSKGLGYYIHFSLEDGEVRVRHIDLQDLRRSKFFDPMDPEVRSFIISLIGEFGNKQEVSRKLFYAARDRGILIMR